MKARASAVVIGVLCVPSQAFELPNIQSFFRPPSTSTTTGRGTANVAPIKAELLGAISGTGNGKTASPETQARVLSLVRSLETASPPSDTLLSDPDEIRVLDGTWYLQYTSPSDLGDRADGSDTEDDRWTPVNPSESGVVETKGFRAQGTVAASGITVDTSNRLTKQTFDVTNGVVANEVDQDFGRVIVGGSFRKSEGVSNRAVVAFKDLNIDLNVGISLRLGWLFALIAVVKGTDVGGWLETTYIDDNMRIGRGNKGTMFVLTRDSKAVIS